MSGTLYRVGPSGFPSFDLGSYRCVSVVSISVAHRRGLTRSLHIVGLVGGVVSTFCALVEVSTGEEGGLQSHYWILSCDTEHPRLRACLSMSLSGQHNLCGL